MKKKNLYFLTIACLIVIIIGLYFFSTFKNKNSIINQGLYGEVVLYYGNCMPGAGGCKISPVSRSIYIREPTSLANMETAIKNKETVIKKIKSNNNGLYQVELPPGTYSIFVEDNGKERCNRFGHYGEACQVTIENELKEYNIKMTHSAAW